MAKEKANLYLLAIVAIVAVVGVVVLVLNSGAMSTSLSESDLSGQATLAAKKIMPTPLTSSSLKTVKVTTDVILVLEDRTNIEALFYPISTKEGKIYLASTKLTAIQKKNVFGLIVDKDTLESIATLSNNLRIQELTAGVWGNGGIKIVNMVDPINSWSTVDMEEFTNYGNAVTCTTECTCTANSCMCVTICI